MINNKVGRTAKKSSPIAKHSSDQNSCTVAADQQALREFVPHVWSINAKLHLFSSSAPDTPNNR